MNWKKIAFILYPVLVGLLLFLLFCGTDPLTPTARAGSIRKVEISQDRPSIVRLAPGRTTALSFSVRPEKVVPGNPQAIEINFLGRDLTIRPLGPRPGNLIVYTKSSRYVILLQLTSEVTYDDAVTLAIGGNHGKVLRLADDSFQIVDLRMIPKALEKERVVTGQLSRSGRVFQTQDLSLPLKCKGCLIKKKEDFVELSCVREITSLECTFPGNMVKLERASK